MMENMKTETQKVCDEFYRGDFSWKVPSKSDPKGYHIVSWGQNVGWRCDCEGFFYSKHPQTCKHIKIIKLKYGDKI